MGLFSGSSSSSTTNNTQANQQAAYDDAVSAVESDIHIERLDGGAIADAFDYSEFTAREAFDIGSESISEVGSVAYEGLALAGDAFALSGDVVRDNQSYSENIFDKALEFLGGGLDKTETLIGETVTDTFELATSAVNKSQESANETLVKYGAGALAIVAVAMIFMGRK